MNRNIIITGMLAVLILASSAFTADLVTIDSVTAYPGGIAVLPIYFENDDQLDAVEVVLSYDTASLTIDSFSVAGSRVEYIDPGTIFMEDSAEYIDLNIQDWGEDSYIPIGSGLLANLFFRVNGSAAGETILIDSTRWPSQYFIRHTSYSVGGISLTPDFEEGYITVMDAPPTNDSVWVDSIAATAGGQAELMVYGKNEEPIQEIDLSLTYTSDDLIYSNTEYSGTRGINAQHLEEVNGSLRQIHINLDYSDSPLPPGSGPLARIVFNVSGAAVSGLVVVDSISYLGITPTEFHQAESAGGLSFAPYFEKGFIEIKLPTDVEDEEPSALPESYALYQNLPNPFNPSTNISFDLPKASHVRLDIINILGQRVFRLVDEKLPAGQHTVTFDTSDKGRKLATGMYFYKLETDDFEESKKMMLIK